MPVGAIHIIIGSRRDISHRGRNFAEIADLL